MTKKEFYFRIMTDKQKLKSLKLKIQRLENNNPNIDFKLVNRYFFDIEKYNKLNQELFFLEFKMNHCETCGKKL